MGALLEKPKTEKQSEAGGGNGLRYGLSSMQGWRIEMEDAHTALTNLQGDLQKWSFFGVFDGHAGARVSAHCSEHLLPSIMDEEQFKTGVLSKESREVAHEDVEVVRKAIRTGFLKLDDAMRHMPEVASGEDKSGTTAVCSLISPDFIFVANCGDSRGILYRRSGIGINTLDHKPFNPCEKERIQNAGGSVMIQRVNGSLAVSRALGDYEYKNVEGKSQCEQLVSPEPEIYVEKRTDEDQFLVLACDGIWDVITNEDVCAFIRSRFAITNDLELITNQVIDTCFHKGSRDNMSVVIIAFPNAPKVDPEAVKSEAQLDAIIERKVTDLCQQPGSVTMPEIMRMLDEENLQGLPPGGGLTSKQESVEVLFRKLRPDCASAVSTTSQPRNDLRAWIQHRLSASAAGSGHSPTGNDNSTSSDGYYDEPSDYSYAEDIGNGSGCSSGDAHDASGDDADTVMVRGAGGAASTDAVDTESDGNDCSKPFPTNLEKEFIRDVNLSVDEDRS